MVPKTAQTVAAVVMLCFMLVGGFYVSNIPVWIGGLGGAGVGSAGGAPAVHVGKGVLPQEQ